MIVYVAVPTTGWVRYELADVLREISHDQRHELVFGGTNLLARPFQCARHWIINEFLATDADALLMMDADVVPYHNPLDLVEHDLDVVAMACPIWRPGSKPPIVLNATPLDGSKTVSLDDGPLMEVSQVSTGAILVARRVLEHPGMKNPFETVYDENGITVMDDDISFYRKAREAGFKVWISLDHICGHVKKVDIVTIHDAVAEWR